MIITQPKKPIIIPRILDDLIFNPKNNVPVSNTNMGTNELKAPVIELSSLVCATAKSTAGIKLPTKPIMKT